MTWKPDLTVAAVIERDGRFLVVEERIGGRLVLNQPAGHVEDGESIIDAVVRETREETAWRFAPAFFLGAYLWRSERSGRSTLRFAFGGTAHDFDASQPLDRGIVTVHWMTRAELLQSEARLRSPLVVQCVDDCIAGRRFPLEAVAYLGSPAPRLARLART